MKRDIFSEFVEGFESLAKERQQHTPVARGLARDKLLPRRTAIELHLANGSPLLSPFSHPQLNQTPDYRANLHHSKKRLIYLPRHIT